MNFARGFLIVVAAGAVGYAIGGLIWLTIRDVGIGVAVAGACWAAMGLLRNLQQERDSDWRLREERRR